MEEVTVQVVYDILLQRIRIVDGLLSDDSVLKIKSKKLRAAFVDAKNMLQKYIDEIDSGLHGGIDDTLDSVLTDVYFNTLYPSEKG